VITKQATPEVGVVRDAKGPDSIRNFGTVIPPVARISGIADNALAKVASLLKK
jgi:hypothetical protein